MPGGGRVGGRDGGGGRERVTFGQTVGGWNDASILASSSTALSPDFDARSLLSFIANFSSARICCSRSSGSNFYSATTIPASAYTRTDQRTMREPLGMRRRDSQ